MKMTLKNKILCVLLCGIIPLCFAACEGDIVGTGTPAGVDYEPSVSTPQKPNVSEPMSSENSESKDNDKIEYPLEMCFTSGAGAWYTQILIHANGSFEGEFHDANMGVIGEEYPNGTVAECKFSGYFSKPEKVNDYTYSLTLKTVEVEGEIGSTRIEDGILYEITLPYGLTNNDGTDYAKDFVLYTPNAPTDEMQEDFMLWWPGRFDDEQQDKLLVYGLQNLETNDGFFTINEN